MKLSRLLRNQDNIIDAVKYALHVVLPADKAEDLCQQIDSGELPVPGGKSLAHSWHKLDCLSVLWERELNSNRRMHRYISADSSLKGYNYFCVRENNVQLPASGDSCPVPLDFLPVHCHIRHPPGKYRHSATVQATSHSNSAICCMVCC